MKTMIGGLLFASILCAQNGPTPPQNGSTQNGPTFSNDYALLNSHIVTVKGTLVPDGNPPTGVATGSVKGPLPNGNCRLELKLKPGERALEARGKSPVRYNVGANGVAGCELEMEVGQPPESAITPGAKNPATNPGPLPADQVAGVTSTGYVKGWFTDPVNIVVNSEQVDIGWQWWGQFAGCTVPGTSRGWSPAWWYGWWRPYFDNYPTYMCADIPGFGFFGTSGAATSSTWENDVFPACLGIPTFVTYEPIEAQGDNLGNLYGDLSWGINGSPTCIYLLTPNFQVVRTYN